MNVAEKIYVLTGPENSLITLSQIIEIQESNKRGIRYPQSYKVNNISGACVYIKMGLSGNR